MNRNFGHPHLRTLLLALCWLVLATGAQARIAMPDHVFYGVATWFGDPVADGTEVTFVLDGQSPVNARYTIGFDSGLAGLYALRIPMDAEEPRLSGRVRPGETGRIYINGNLVAQVTVGDYGQVTRLDIDPVNLSGSVPTLAINDTSLLEGDSGTAQMQFTVNMNTAAGSDVTVNWETQLSTGADAANGAAQCGTEVDFEHASGVLTLPAGSTSATVSVTICGDTLIEASETFQVRLSAPTGAVIQFDTGTGTIVNDDGQPEIRLYDRVAVEPVSGTLTEQMEVVLSRSYTLPVTVQYSTRDLSATAGTDYQAASGTVTIPAGQTRAGFNITLLSDGMSEGPEVLQVDLSNPQNGLLQDATGVMVILDSGQRPETRLQQENTDGSNSVTGLARPAALALSPDGAHLYVTTLTDRSVVWFDVDGSNGQLSYAGMVDNNTVGAENAALDGAWSIVISDDGRHVYVGAQNDAAISHFSRNTSDGSLSYVDRVDNAGAGNALTYLRTLRLSPDGNHLYAAGKNANAVAWFSVDGATGTLAYQGKVSTADNGLSFLMGPSDLAFSDDGSRLYVTADFGQALFAFSRNPATGALSLIGSLKEGVGQVSGLNAPSSVRLSPDGAHLYVTARAESTLAEFDILADGSVQHRRTLRAGNGDFAAMQGPPALTVPPQGNRLFVLGQDDSSLVVFSRENDNSASGYGRLSFLDVKLDDSSAVSNLGGPVNLVHSADGKWIYVVASQDNTVAVFSNESLFPLFVDGFE